MTYMESKSKGRQVKVEYITTESNLYDFEMKVEKGCVML